VVFVNLLEKKSQNLLKYLQDNVVCYRNVDSVIEYEKLCDIYLSNITGESATSRNDFELVLKYLEVNQKCIINHTELENKALVKFALNMNGYVQPLTQVEKSYQSLKYTETKLEVEVDKYCKQIETTNEAVKSYLSKNNKNTALKLLKKRKQLEKSLHDKEETLGNIQAMMCSIQQADTNQLTFDVYSKSAEALKEAQKLVNIDKVDETMADIQDALSTNADIEEALKSPVGFKFNKVDEDELNTELNELLAEQMDKNKLPTLDPESKVSVGILDFDSKDENKSFNMTDILNTLNSIEVPNHIPNKLTSSKSLEKM
jgi:vacuolar-type H+-ATPase subunit I/STV1